MEVRNEAGSFSAFDSYGGLYLGDMSLAVFGQLQRYSKPPYLLLPGIQEQVSLERVKHNFISENRKNT